MHNKTLFITGGNGEIGSAIARQFRQEGYHIIAPGSGAMDCSDVRSIAAFTATIDRPITAFVHCAGINVPKPYTSITQDTFERTFRINTLSFLQLFQQLTPHFVDNETKVIAISSIYGIISRTGRLEYSTAKHGMIGMMQALALEAAPRGILVNAISPGFIETRLTHKNNPPEVVQSLIADVPLRRLGSPEDIAELAAFLCSDRNRFITGQNIVIDGGYLAGGFQP